METLHPPVLIHVGYIKTGTTYLQNSFFSRPDSGLELAAGEATRAQTVQNILLADDYNFDAAQIRNHMEDIALPVRARGNTPVWSEESLLGNPPSARYDGFSNARKIKAVFPDAQVLITIRRQQSIALSMFREYVLGDGTLPIGSFIGTGKEALSFTPILRPEFLFYDRAIRHYQELFGADRVLVLPQEMLARDPEQYVKMLYCFAGRKVLATCSPRREHVGEGDLALVIRRAVNRLIVNDHTTPGRQGLAKLANRTIRLINRLTPQRINSKLSRHSKDFVKARYTEFYAASNRETAKLTSLNLKDYGYDT